MISSGRGACEHFTRARATVNVLLARNATNINKKLKEDLAIAMSELNKLTRGKEESGAEKVAFREALDRTHRHVVGGGNRPTLKRPEEGAN